MEVTLIVCVALIVTGFLVNTWLKTRVTAEPTARAVPDSKKQLPIAQPSGSCEDCMFWSLKRGQQELQSNPAFFGATQHLQPYQMAEKRDLKPNPKYLEQQKWIEALAIDEAKAKLQGDLEAYAKVKVEREAAELELNDIAPDVLEKTLPDANEPMLDASWDDLGACRKHRELTFKVHSCDDWAQQLVEVAS